MLRHTFGTYLASKLPVPDVHEKMGHTDIRTTQRYLHALYKASNEAGELVVGRFGMPASEGRRESG